MKYKKGMRVKALYNIGPYVTKDRTYIVTKNANDCWFITNTGHELFTSCNYLQILDAKEIKTEVDWLDQVQLNFKDGV